MWQIYKITIKKQDITPTPDLPKPGDPRREKEPKESLFVELTRRWGGGFSASGKFPFPFFHRMNFRVGGGGRNENDILTDISLKGYMGRMGLRTIVLISLSLTWQYFAKLIPFHGPPACPNSEFACKPSLLCVC